MLEQNSAGGGELTAAEEMQEETLELEELFQEAEEDGAPPDEEGAPEQPGEPEREEGGSEEQEGSAQPEERPVGETFTLRYNGQELQLDRDQVITAAQKGLNYDKVAARLQEMQKTVENSREVQLLEAYARSNGMTLPDFIGAMEGHLQAQRVQALSAQGVPEEQARELVRLQGREAVRQQENAARERVQRQAQVQQMLLQRQKAQWMEFVEAYPDVKTLPPEVQGQIRAGLSPLQAYIKWENAQLKTALAQRESAQKAKDKAVGSASGEGPGEEGDPFLAGFNGAW